MLNDKIILVHYVNVDTLKETNSNKSPYDGMKIYYEMLDNNNYTNFIIPVNGETRIDCINPKYVKEDEYKLIMEKINNLELKLNDFLDKK